MLLGGGPNESKFGEGFNKFHSCTRHYRFSCYGYFPTVPSGSFLINQCNYNRDFLSRHEKFRPTKSIHEERTKGIY